MARWAAWTARSAAASASSGRCTASNTVFSAWRRRSMKVTSSRPSGSTVRNWGSPGCAERTLLEAVGA